jgi:Protein of unknown function (DUF3025)
MKPLVPVRRAAGFRPHFFKDAFTRAVTGDPLFWPLQRAAKALAGYDDFPPVDALASVFHGEPPVRFVPAAPRRRRGASVDVRALYDARITLDREVPTRHRSWHDLMNVLVWGTFPHAKRALHARQHRAIAERLAPGARRLPPTRTPELDALALLDEGGVVLVSPPSQNALRATDDAGPRAPHAPIVFGHAIYESLVLGVAPAVVAAIALSVQPSSHDRVGLEWDLVGAVDRALAAVIDDPAVLRTPGELRRVRIGHATAAPPTDR